MEAYESRTLTLSYGTKLPVSMFIASEIGVMDLVKDKT